MLTIGAKKYIDVVACILKKENRILISTRPLNKIYSGFYEFPGGKVKRGEYLTEALFREIKEELGIKLNFNKLFFLRSYIVNQNKKNLRLHFFLCLNWNGKIYSKEGQTFNWVFPSKLRNYNFLKSNNEIIRYLLRFIFPTTY